MAIGISFYGKAHVRNVIKGKGNDDLVLLLRQSKSFGIYRSSMNISSTKKLFLAAPRFAVVGASKDEGKYGTKVSVSCNERDSSKS